MFNCVLIMRPLFSEFYTALICNMNFATVLLGAAVDVVGAEHCRSTISDANVCRWSRPSSHRSDRSYRAGSLALCACVGFRHVPGTVRARLDWNRRANCFSGRQPGACWDAFQPLWTWTGTASREKDWIATDSFSTSKGLKKASKMHSGWWWCP